MRVVLDTNTLVSALLFSGTASRLPVLWRSRAITILASKRIVEEYLRVLAYPKFHLTAEEIRGLWEEEVLPFVEAVRVRARVRSIVRDADDRKFVECAVSGSAEYVISGDRALLALQTYRGIEIVPVGRFLDETGLGRD
jgi:putative PIN family toxin of toxin-antitoxin system